MEKKVEKKRTKTTSEKKMSKEEFIKKISKEINRKAHLRMMQDLILKSKSYTEIETKDIWGSLGLK